MYTDLTNKLNTGIKSRFTGFDSTNQVGAPASHETKSFVGSALTSLAKALDRFGSTPVLDDSLFGLHAYIAGDFGPGRMTQDARRLAKAAAKTGGADVLAKAYLGYDYFDFLADHGYLAPAAVQDVVPTAHVAAPRAELQPAA